MAQSIITVIKIFLPIIISGNVLISACSSVSISSSHTSSHGPVYEHPHGSDRPVPDVVRLHDAIINNDRREIVEIFIMNNLYSRPFLHDEHVKIYKSDLKGLCRAKLSGDFGHLITSLATPPWTFLVSELHYFFQSFHGDYSTLEEILGYHGIEGIKEAYQSEYGVEVTEHFRKLPYFVQRRFAHQIDGIYNSGSIKLADDQANYYRIKLVEAKNKSDARHFTRLIVLMLNDELLDKVKISYENAYGKPLASIINELPEGDYREAISAILSPPVPFGNDALPIFDHYKK
ncbi:uncharacterized protein LOC130673126 isoform X1 [Microplitis mediator]|uniref:uncharacterized protein LOC130673126 isoform X1 n=1 Tax=Microplitis mediator TaxID=375433 RepID=UPI002555A091|nr:uncharacterized protein LOC130673126 isoform X1 [Microplitis mediator]